jgi:hypothetical protein
MLVSFCLPHGFNLAFSRQIIIIFTGLMDIFHKFWILFVFNIYPLNLILNVNQYLYSRITNIELVTN